MPLPHIWHFTAFFAYFSKVSISVATGLLKISPDFVTKKTQKNPDREN